METAVAITIWVAGLCFAFSEGAQGPDIVNFLGALGFFCASVWLGNIFATWDVEND